MKSSQTTNLTEDDKFLIEKLLMFKQHASQNTWNVMISESAEMVAAKLLKEISEMIDPGSRDKLIEAWRESRLNGKTTEFQTACSLLIKQIEFKS